MRGEEERLRGLFGRLDGAGRRSLLDYAEFLAARPRAAAPAAEPVPRPQQESVTQAIKRLNRTYPMPKRHRLMPRVEQLLAQHMIEDRPGHEVIDELEAYFAAEYRSTSGE